MRTSIRATLAAVLVVCGIWLARVGMNRLDEFWNGEQATVGLDELAEFPDSLEVLASGTAWCGASSRCSILYTDAAVGAADTVEASSVLRDWLVGQGFVACPEGSYWSRKGEFQSLEIGAEIWEESGDSRPWFADEVRNVIEEADVVLRIWPSRALC